MNYPYWFKNKWNMTPVVFNIKRLGAIRDSSITHSPMMIFSGESGLGKSYAAFLVHYLYIVVLDQSRLYKFFSSRFSAIPDPSEEKERTSPILSIPVSDVMEWLNKDAISYIGYLIGDNSFTGDVDISLDLNRNTTFDFYFDAEMKGLESEEEIYYNITLGDFSYSIISSNYKPSWDAFVSLLMAYLRDKIFGDMKNVTNTFLLPPSRGSLMEMDERPNFQSGMYHEFFSLKALLNVPQRNGITPNPIIAECSRRLNGGQLRREAGKYLYDMDNGQQIPLTAAASSIKELSPLTLFLNKYSVKGVSILFEEPEAHIHPSRQVILADLLACIIQSGGHLQITTHSDYLIKRLNNLMKLSLLSEKKEKSTIKAIIDEFGINSECLLSSELVKAYLITDNGDGTSSIKEQTIGEDNSIPFESFYNVIDEDIKLTHKIAEIEYNN